MSLFPFAEYWWFYGVFTLFVLLMLAIDLGVFHRKAHAVSFKEASIWSVVWVTLALAFNFVLYKYALWKFPQDQKLMAISGFNPDAAAWAVSLEFLTGYVVEKSLSVDNIFIFVMVFAYFAIPTKYQHRVLFYGILGALVFRAIFIAMGSALMQLHWVIYLFGGFLIVTGIKMFFAGKEEIEPEKNLLIRIFQKDHARQSTPGWQELFLEDRWQVARDAAFHCPPISRGDRYYLRGGQCSGYICHYERTLHCVQFEHLRDHGT